MREHSLEQAAAEQLQEAGFFVEREAHAAGAKGKTDFQVDVLAWAGDESGDLIPEVVVEVKATLHGSLEKVLAQLSRVAAVMGARRAFLFDGRWREADPTFTRLENSDCPRPAIAATNALVPRHLIERELWAMREQERGHRPMARGSEWAELVAQAFKGDANTALSRLCASARSRLSLARILSEGADELEVPAALTDALVRLLAPSGSISVLDPACRLGGALLAVAEVCPQATLQGWWPNESAVHAARALGRLCHAPVDLACASFEEVLAKRVAVDAVISVPPFGMRLRERVQLGDASTSADLDVALVDRVAGWLKPGGRAVVVVPPRLLFADTASALRRRLSADLRVVAVVELPSGVFESTKIPVAIVVLERRPATETLVARLRVDWKSQLAPSGEFLVTYQRHLAGAP
jgi:SAM-dependent methyltransferase